MSVHALLGSLAFVDLKTIANGYPRPALLVVRISYFFSF